jgi:hypothetical protein
VKGGVIYLLPVHIFVFVSLAGGALVLVDGHSEVNFSSFPLCFSFEFVICFTTNLILGEGGHRIPQNILSLLLSGPCNFPDPCVSGPQGIFCTPNAAMGLLYLTQMQFGYISLIANLVLCRANATIQPSIAQLTRLDTLSTFVNVSVAILTESCAFLGRYMHAVRRRGRAPLISGEFLLFVNPCRLLLLPFRF